MISTYDRLPNDNIIKIKPILNWTYTLFVVKQCLKFSYAFSTEKKMIVFHENRKTAGSFQNCTVIFGIWQQLRPFEKNTYLQ